MSFRATRDDKRVIINRIQEAAKIYKDTLVGKTFLVLYEGKSVEMIFKTDNFMHLCGVDSRLAPKDFLKRAVKGELRTFDIGFSDNIHPYRFADIKTEHLKEALSILQRESLIITDIYTQTRNYKLGTTDLEVVFCFDEQTDDEGYPINEILNPFSLRIEEIANSRFDEMYEVDFVLSKKTGTKEYDTIEFGNKELLNDYIKDNDIDKYLINIPHEKCLSHKELLEKGREAIEGMKESIILGSNGNIMNNKDVAFDKSPIDDDKDLDITDDTDPKTDSN